MRLLIANKRNYPIAMDRKSLRNKGKLFSQYGVLMRCVRENHSASIINMHYLENSSIVLAIQVSSLLLFCALGIGIAFQFRRELFYIPLMYIVKALVEMNDSLIFEHLTRARQNDNFWAGCVTNMLSSALDEGITTKRT